MDYNDIGTIIANARKKKGMTQDDLAGKLHLTRQAISTWETNKSLPDIGIILKLCEVLDLDFNKFIGVANGVIKAEDIIKYEKKKITKKTIVIITILSILFALISFTIYMVLNKNAFAVYDVYLDSNEFSLSNSILVKSKINNYFKLGTLKCNLDDVPEDTVYDIKLYSIQDDKKVVLLEQKYEDNLSVYEKYGYNKYFSSDIFNAEELYLDIKYTIKDKPYIYTYPLNLKLNFESNRLFYKQNSKVIKNSNEIIDIDKLYIDKLIIAGYEYDEERDAYVRKFSNGEYAYDINSNYLMYNYEDSKTMIGIKYYFNDKSFEVSEYNSEMNIKFNYNKVTNELVCIIGKCKNYLNYINVIEEEIKIINP